MTRNQQIRAEYEAGDDLADMAARWGISKSRVSSIAMTEGAAARSERHQFAPPEVAAAESSRRLLHAMLASGQHELDSLAVARIRGAAIGMAAADVRRSVLVSL